MTLSMVAEAPAEFIAADSVGEVEEAPGVLFYVPERFLSPSQNPPGSLFYTPEYGLSAPSDPPPTLYHTP